jgi:hypothetical protein
MSGFLAETRKGCGRSLVFQLLAAVLVIPLFIVFLLIPIWAFTNFNLSNWVLIVPAVLLILILSGGGVFAVFIVISRRSRLLDEVFVPLGLSGRLYQMTFRQYRGIVAGRVVRAFIQRGPTLELEVATPLQTRLGIARQASATVTAAHLLNRVPLHLDDPALADYLVFPADQAWARNLLVHPEMPVLLKRLLEPKSLFTSHQLLVRSGWFQLYLYGSRNFVDFIINIKKEDLKGWLDDLLELVSLAESSPAPQVRVEPMRAEQIVEKMRNANPYVMPAIILAMTILPVFCIVLGTIWVFGFR